LYNSVRGFSYKKKKKRKDKKEKLCTFNVTFRRFGGTTVEVEKQ
jgi:hypothetical protein